LPGNHTHSTEEIDRPRGVLIQAAVLAATTTFIAIRASRVIREFEVLFKGFGTELDALTRFLMAVPDAWWVLALASIALLLWIGRRSRAPQIEIRRMKLALGALTIATGVSVAIAIIGLYLPIFKLGAVV
jgi:type II secretory pathway component PulF